MKKVALLLALMFVFCQNGFANKFFHSSDGQSDYQEIKSGGTTHRYGNDGSYQGTEIDTDYRYDVSKNSW